MLKSKIQNYGLRIVLMPGLDILTGWGVTPFTPPAILPLPVPVFSLRVSPLFMFCCPFECMFESEVL